MVKLMRTMSWCHSARASVPLMVMLLLGAALPAQGQWSSEGGVVLQGTIVTMASEADIVDDGQIYVVDGTIVAIIGAGESWPDGVDTTGATVLATDGYIFPGMINAHNHTAYNTLPLWEAPKLYTNRYQWTSPADYSTYVNYPKKLLTDSNYFNMTIEVCKYAEIKSLVGGETAVQGTPDRKGLSDMLIRNVESKNFDQDKVFQRGLTIDDPRWQVTIPTFLDKAADGNVDAWIVHLAEGTDEDPSHEEFDTLVSLGMLEPWTVVIHGTALQEVDFAEMADVGAKLIWSPTSNMLLYGGTTRVDQALAAGMTVTLATDWSPSGPKNLLDELKVAWELNTFFATVDGMNWTPFDEYTLVSMATANGADALGWSQLTGRLAEGLAGDLMVIDKPQTADGDIEPTPYQALIAATVRDVRLVMVGGEPLYGDVDLMQTAKGSDMEVLCSTAGFVKAIDVTRDGVKKGDQTYSALKTTLETAMQFDPEHMRLNFKQSKSEEWTPAEFDEWFQAKFKKGVVAMPLDPLFVTDDPVFFARFDASVNAQWPFDLQANYYSFLGDGPTAAVDLGVDDQQVLDFVNGATEETLVGDVGLSPAAASEVLGGVPYATVDALTSEIGGCGVVVLQSFLFADTEPPPPPPPPEEETVEGEAALLALLNDASTTLEVLDDDAGLNKNAATAIITYRNGPDGVFGTADDNLFDSEAEVDAVSYVGPSALEDLYAFAAIWQETPPVADSDVKLLAFVNHPTTTLELLDDEVGLTKTAAVKIIEHRNGGDGVIGTPDDDLFDDRVELDAVPYVGPSALATLEAWAATWEEPSPDAAVLAFVNDSLATQTVFDIEVGLNVLAANNIVAHRAGPDGEDGTADDDPFDTIEELDAVPYVGPSALGLIFDYAFAWELVEKGPPKVAVFLNHETTTYDLLNETVGLNSNAAANVIAHRDGADGELGTADDNPFDTLAEVDEVKQIGQVTLQTLIDYADTWTAGGESP